MIRSVSIHHRINVSMKRLQGQQQGASIIATIIFLAILAYGVFIGIQYVPQLIESKSIGSILSSINSDEKIERDTSVYAVKEKLIKLLQINEMDYMIPNSSVKGFNGNITIKFSYERELDLIYKTKKINYERVLVLE